MKNQSSLKEVSVKFRVVAALVVVLGFAVLFQNCGMQVRFASTEGKLLAKNVSVANEAELSESNQDSIDELETATPTATPAPEDNSEVISSASPTATPAPDASSEGDEDGGGPLNFVCVLEGPGRSVLLGYVDSTTVAANQGTPETICTTKRGCEEIAKQKFDVKEALEREYCEKNKNVIKVTEDVLSTLINAL